MEQPASSAISNPGFLGRYIVGEEIGRGTNGAALRCYPRETPWVCLAVKVLYTPLHYTPASLGAHQREISLLSTCVHTNIIKLHDCFTGATAATQSLIITECGETDLLAQLELGLLPTDGVQRAIRVWPWIAGMCAALDYLHSNNIVHRDVKLENAVLVNGTVKLIDFGAATYVPPEGLQGLIGTYVYMAPEVQQGAAQYFPIDCWSMGITAQALFLGLLPISNTLKQDWLESCGIPPECTHFVTALLNRDPIQRWTMAQALTMN